MTTDNGVNMENKSSFFMGLCGSNSTHSKFHLQYTTLSASKIFKPEGLNSDSRKPSLI